MLPTLAALALVLAPQEIERGAPPPWVEPLEVPEPAGGPASGGVEFLLQDAQDDLRGASPVRYRRMVTRVAGPAGVESESRLEIEFDPQAESLVLHRVVVSRDGARGDRLEGLDVRVLQRERGLEESLVDGRVTALAFLADVREGDLVDVAYSLHGRKAVLGERWFDVFATAWGVDVRRLHRRVLVGARPDLRVRCHAGAPEPEARGGDGARELVWDLRDVAARPIEENVPGWHDLLPWVQLSEYADWPSVARWGAALFELPDERGAALQGLADEIAAASDAPLERTRLALRRVQSEVRYLGLVFGEGSHRPNAPEVVLARRFGDCKDKALLLCALLEALGVEARPALVNTTTLRGVGAQLPSPGAFDHAVVRAVVDGDDLWLDPTLSAERGPIDEWSLPAYGWALVLDAGRGDLVEVERARGQVPSLCFEKRYVVRAGGAVELEVVSTYGGARANGVRDGLHSLGAGELARICRQYIAEQHARAEPIGEPVVEDDPDANRLVVRERYRIPDPWGRARWATFGCAELAGELVWPVAVQRRHPFALPHPGRFEQHLTVELPGLEPTAPEVVRVQEPAFRFESRVAARRGALAIDATYEALRDHVDARDVARYSDALSRAEVALFRDLARPGSAAAAASLSGPESGRDLGRSVLLLAFALAVLGSFLARARSTRRIARTRQVADVPRVEGKSLVLPRHLELPDACVRCAAPGDVEHTLSVSWHPAWVYLLVPGTWFYAYACGSHGDSQELRACLCARHDRRQRLRTPLNVATIFLGTLVMFVGVEYESPLMLVGFVGLVVGVVRVAIDARLLRAVHMDEHTVHLRGFGRAYLDSVEASTSSGNVPEERSASSTALRSAA